MTSSQMTPATQAFYFGTFNPVHWGHLLIAQAALNQFALARVVFVPAACSPFRQQETDMASGADRLAILRRAIADNPGFAVDSIEIDRDGDGPSYTIDTIRALRARDASILTSDGRLAVIIGSDALSQTPRWRDPRALMAATLWLQAPRPETPPVEALAFEGEPLPLATRLIDAPANALSASRVRAALRAGQSARYLTPDAALDLIHERRLWQNPEKRA
ncbi:MAG: nicotinate (nicotinamide) nucleotide adenylyltransferase [Vampirovibrionales bacterium]|nr:nicotinate (nicotinamide) nucleotide adenylyltransferase [Vampirovibrionales bacterium]